MADIPDSRCAVVGAGQWLMFVNDSGRPLEVDLGPYAATLAPGEAYLIEAPF